MKKTISWVLIVQLLFPPQVLLSAPTAVAQETTETETTPSSNAPTDAQPIPAAGTRAKVLHDFLVSSSKIRSAVAEKVPGILAHHLDASQLALSAVAHCPTTVPQEDALLPELDASIRASAKSLFEFLANRKDELGKYGDNLKQHFGESALVETISIESKPCQPDFQFQSPLSNKDTGNWKLKSRLAVETKWEDLQRTAPGNLFFSIGTKTEKSPITNEELDQWMSWLNWLIEFRESLAIQKNLRRKGSAASFAGIQVSSELGSALKLVLAEMRQNKAYENLRDRDRKRLTLAQVTAEKLIQASVNAEKLPRLEQVGNAYLFVPAQRQATERLAEKVVIALQDPTLGPGAYLDAMVALAKQSSILELISLNSLLPARLKLKTLPATVAASIQDPNQFGAEEFKEFIGMFHSLSSVEYRYWWAHQLGLGFQQMVHSIQTRQLRAVIPPRQPHIITDNETGEKNNLYSLGDQIVTDFVEKLLDVSASSDALDAGQRQRIAEARANVLARVKQQSFEGFLRNQLGLDSADDVSSILAEKLLVLTALLRPNLIENLTPQEWKAREEVYLPLLREVVASTLTDTLGHYALQQLDVPELVEKLPDGSRKPVFPSLFQQASILWRETYGTEWVQLLQSDDKGRDTTEIAKSLHTHLLSTDAMMKVKELSEEKGSDAVVEQLVAKRVEESMKLVEEAAKAEETIQYMGDLVGWKSNPVWNFMPGPQNYYYLEAQGAAQGKNAACFHVDNRDAFWQSRGHGTGRNTYGELKPQTPEDYLHLKIALQTIAQRNLEGLTERLKKRPDIAAILKTYGIANEEALAREVLLRFLQVVEAKPGSDKVRVSEAREHAGEPLKAWLVSGAEPRREYTQGVESAVSSWYRTQFKPLAEEIATVPSAEKKDAWLEYAKGAIERLNNELQPVLIQPIELNPLLALHEQSGHADANNAESLASKIRAFHDEVAKSGVFAKPANANTESQAFAAYCQANREACLGWLETLEKLVGDETLKLLYQARFSLITTKRLLKDRSSLDQPSLLKNLGAEAKQEILGFAWFGEPLPGESFFWFPELFKNSKGIPTPPDRSLRWQGPLEAFIVENKTSDRAKALLQVGQTLLPQVMQPRIDAVQKTFIPKLSEYLSQLSENQSLTRDQLLASTWKQVEEDKLFDLWREQLKGLIRATRELVSSNDDILIGMGFHSFRNVLDRNLVSVSATDRVEYLRTRADKPVIETLIRKHLFNYDQFQIKALNLLSQAVAPQMDPTEEILDLEKRLRDTHDALESKKFDLQGYDDHWAGAIPNVPLIRTDQKPLQLQVEAAQEQIKALETQRAYAYSRLKSDSELKRLLSLVLGNKPEAQAMLKAMGSAENDATALMTSVFQQSLDARRIRTKHTLSVKQILSDLNRLANKHKAYIDIDPKVAQAYLAEVKNYFGAGFQSAEANTFLETYFQKTLLSWIDAARNPNLDSRVKKSLSNQLHKITAIWLKHSPLSHRVGAIFGIGPVEKLNRALRAEDFLGTLEGEMIEALHRDAKSLHHGLVQIADELSTDIKKLEANKEQASIFLASPELREKYWEFVELTSHLLFSGASYYQPVVIETADGMATVWVRSAPSDFSLRGEDLLAWTTRRIQLDVARGENPQTALKQILPPPPQTVLTALYRLLRQPSLTQATFEEIWPASAMQAMQMSAPTDFSRDGLRSWLLRLDERARAELYVTASQRFASILAADQPVPTVALDWQRSTKDTSNWEYEAIHTDWLMKLQLLIQQWQQVALDVKDRAEIKKEIAQADSKAAAKEEPTVPAASEPTVPAASEPTVPAASEPTVPAASEPTVPAASEPTVPQAEPASVVASEQVAGASVAPTTTPTTTENTAAQQASATVVPPPAPVASTNNNPTATYELARALFTLFTHGTQYRLQKGKFVLHDKDRNKPTDASDAEFEKILAAGDLKTLYRILNQIVGIVVAEQDRSQVYAREAAAAVLRGEQAWSDLSGEQLMPFYGDLKLGRPARAPYFNGNRDVVFEPLVLFFASLATDFSPEQSPTASQIWEFYFNTEMIADTERLAGSSITFEPTWKPDGSQPSPATSQTKRFVTWFDYLLETEAAAHFKKLRESRETSDSGRLWDHYESLEQMKSEPDSAYAQVIEFLSKWDGNRVAQADVETYPYFVATLHKHIQYPLAVASPQRARTLPPQVVSHLLRELLAELELDVEDFQGWKQLLDKHSRPEDWFLMAQSKKHALVETGHRRFLSIRIDAPVVTNPYGLGTDYNYRPFPLESVSAEGEIQSDGLELATKHRAGDWLQLTESFDRTAVYQTLTSDKKEVPLYERLLSARLDKQDSLHLQAQSKSLNTLKSQIEKAVDDRFGSRIDDKTTPLETQAPVEHDRFAKYKGNWKTYFAHVQTNLAGKPDPQASSDNKAGLWSQLVSQVQRESKNSQLSSAQIDDIVRKREAFVALTKAVNELVKGYSFEGTRLKQWRGNDLTTEAITNVFSTELENEVNLLLSAYKDHIGVNHPAKIKLHRTGVEALRREAAGKAIYLGWNLLQTQMPKDSDGVVSMDARKALLAADGFYRQKAAVHDYYAGLLEIGKNILENMGLLFAESDLRSRITTEAQFMAEADRIWKLKLPLMDNLMKMMDEFAPTKLGDTSRQLLQKLVIKDQVERRKTEEVYNVFYMGALSIVLLGFVAPHMASGLGVFTQALPWWLPAPQLAGLTFAGSMGYLFVDHLNHRYTEDFVNAPNRLAIEATVRDSHIAGYETVMGYLILMKDESAYQMDSRLRGLELVQKGNFYWAMRALDVMLVWGTVVRPLGRLAMGGARVLYSTVRAVPSAIRGPAVLKAHQERALLAQTQKQAQAAGQYVGIGQITEQQAAQAQHAIESGVENTIAGITKEWAGQGLGKSDKALRDLLDQYSERRIQEMARQAGLDLSQAGLPAVKGNSLPSRWWHGAIGKLSKTAELQEKQRRLIQQLRELQARLRMGEELSHFSVDDLAVLLGEGGSVYQAYTWAPLRYLQINRMGLLQPEVRRLRQLQVAMQQGMQAQQALSYYFLGRWTRQSSNLLKQLADGTGRTKEEWIKKIANGEAFVEGEIVKFIVPKFPYNDMLRLANELRSILAMGQIHVTDELAAALAAEDFGALLSMFRQAKPTAFIGTGSLALQKAEPAAAPVQPTPAIPTPTTPVSGFSLETEDVIQMVSKKLATRPVQESQAIEQFLREKLPNQIDGIFIDRDTVVELILKYDSNGLKQLLGQHMRYQGLQLGEKAAQVRLAAEWRRAIELDLGGMRGNLVGGTQVSERLVGFYEVYLKDGSKLLQNHRQGAGLSVLEAKGILGVDSTLSMWNTKDLALAKANLPVAVADEAVVAAERTLSKYNFRTRNMDNLEDLVRLHDVPAEFLQVKGTDQVLKSFTGFQVKLQPSETIFLSQLTGAGELVDAYQASRVLGLRYGSTTPLTVEQVQTRAAELRAQLEALYGANSPTALAGAPAPSYIEFAPLERVNKAEEMLIHALTK